MDIKTIRELAAILRENGLSRIEISENGTHICLVAGADRASSTNVTSVQTTVTEAASQTSVTASPKAAGNAVKSPLVGTVYLKPNADAAPYVSVGSKVTKGDTLCLVESMKMYNDISATCTGTIAEICVTNGESVDYGQVLFIIKE